MLSNFINVKQAAKIAGVSTETIRRWRIAGFIESFVIEKTVLINKDSLLNYANRNDQIMIDAEYHGSSSDNRYNSESTILPGRTVSLQELEKNSSKTPINCNVAIEIDINGNEIKRIIRRNKKCQN